MIRSLLSRWADADLRRRIAQLEQRLAATNEDLRAARATIEIRDLENKELSAVAARNIARVEAETAAASAKIAEHTQ